MQILLTNDDGYLAEGILVLENVLRRYGHTVCVVAPHTQQSAKSHSMTVHGCVTVWRRDEMHYSLEGTPSDCVIFPLRSGFLPFVPDVVVSGINHGYNLSSDTIYSGTCAAARQGAMYHIPSIAISAEKEKGGVYDFEVAADWLSRHLECLVSVLDGESFLNLNFPPHWNGEVRKAGLGSISYYDRYTCRDEGGKIVLEGEGCTLDFKEIEKGYPGDRILAEQGYATCTVISVHPVSDRERMERLTL